MTRDYANRKTKIKGRKKKRFTLWVIVALLSVVAIIGFFFPTKNKHPFVASVQKYIPVGAESKKTKGFDPKKVGASSIRKTINTPRFVFYNVLNHGGDVEKGVEYRIEIFATKDFAKADKLKAELALLGFESSIDTAYKRWTRSYSVVIGPYDSKESAISDQQKLKRNKIDGSLQKMR